jgi:hypothetical protein
METIKDPYIGGLGFWSHIEAQIGTQFSALGSHCRIPDSWRVLKTRKDSDSHPPPLPAGGLPVCTGPDFPIFTRKRISQLSLFSVLSIASTKLRDKRYPYLIVDCEEKAYYLFSHTYKERLFS